MAHNTPNGTMSDNEHSVACGALSRKFLSRVKIGPGGPELAAKIGPPLPKMVRMHVLRSRVF